MKLSVRVGWMLMLFLSTLWSMGQPLERVRFQNSFEYDESLQLALNRIAALEAAQQVGVKDWSAKGSELRRYVGISHVPSSDFNIYLTFNSVVTPKIMTSLEVSLNYAGVMNLKSLIFLRKRSNENKN